jgi:hypothetical protein
LSVLAYIVGHRRIILDAGWTLSESTEIRTRSASRAERIYGLVKTTVIDFLALRTSKLTFLESQEEKEFVTKKFRLKNAKTKVGFTSFDELSFMNLENLVLGSDVTNILEETKPVVFFRGKYTVEAGIESLLNASFYLANRVCLVVATNYVPNRPDSRSDAVIIDRFLNKLEIRSLYEKAAICVGQLSSERRLSRTLPHKIFEAAYFGCPYLTPPQKSISECFPDNSLLLLSKNASPKEIANYILLMLEEKEKLDIIKRSFHDAYVKNCSQEIVSRDFLIKSMEI